MWVQCLVTEDSLDYLLFKKLPGNTYDKKYIRSPSVARCSNPRDQSYSHVSRSANTCIAWNTHVYSATSVDLAGVASLFPQTNLASACMVHLWPRTAGGSHTL